MKSCINGATTMPYSLEQDISAASVAGFSGVEIWIDKLRKFLEAHTKEDLKRLLTDSKISAPSLCAFSGFTFCSEEEYGAKVEALKRFLEIGGLIGTEYVIVCADALGGMSFESAKRAYVSRLRNLGSVTSKYGVKVALEWFWELPPAIDIIEAIDDEHVGFVLDTFHWYRADGSLENLKKVPSGKLFFVHINDCEDLPKKELTDKNRLYCGSGVIPLLDIFKIFEGNDYRGYLSVEIFREEYWRKDSQEISMDAHKTLIETALRASVSVS